MINGIKKALGLASKYEGEFHVQNIWGQVVPIRRFRWKEGDPGDYLAFIYSSSDRKPKDWDETPFGRMISKDGESLFRKFYEPKIMLGDRLEVILGRPKFLEISPDRNPYEKDNIYGLKVPPLLSYKIVDPSIERKEPDLVATYDDLTLKVRMKRLGLRLPEGYKEGDNLGTYARPIIFEPVEEMRRIMRIETRTEESLRDKIEDLKKEITG